jgi:hypothetical protein
VKRIVPEIPQANGESALSRGWRRAVTLACNNVQRRINYQHAGTFVGNAAFGQNTELFAMTVPVGLVSLHGEALKIKATGLFSGASTDKEVMLVVDSDPIVTFTDTAWSGSFIFEAELTYDEIVGVECTAKITTDAGSYVSVGLAGTQFTTRSSELALWGSATAANNVRGRTFAVDFIGRPL